MLYIVPANIVPAICPMRKSKTIAYKIPYKILLLYILQNFIWITLGYL